MSENGCGIRHTPAAMRRHSGFTHWLLWSLALAFVVVRASDTHLHLCFDGQEPPATLHLGDASVHDDHHQGDHEQGETHSDKDVDPFVGVLTKKAEPDLDGAIAVVVVLALLLPAVSDTVPLDFDSAPVLRDLSHHWRPPLRGPPA